jgi:hypothetical protein
MGAQVLAFLGPLNYKPYPLLGYRLLNFNRQIEIVWIKRYPPPLLDLVGSKLNSFMAIFILLEERNYNRVSGKHLVIYKICFVLAPKKLLCYLSVQVKGGRVTRSRQPCPSTLLDVSLLRWFSLPAFRFPLVHSKQTKIA